MRASALARVTHRHGRDEVVERRAASPLAIRSSGGRVLLASTAAAPVGGDELEVHVVVDEGATADVGSVAATVVWPGPDGAASLLRTRCDVGTGAHLDLMPEPIVSVAGSRHRSVTRVHLAAGATCRIVEELSLGRTGEPSGDLAVSLRVERDGGVLVHHDETFGPRRPGTATSVGIGAARHVLSAVVVGVVAGEPRVVVEPRRAIAWMPVAGDAVVVMAVGSDRPAVRALLAAVAPEVLVSGRP
jgi:urease accessory protein